MNELIIIKTTVKSEITKNKIIDLLIKNEYVACINEIENVSSHFKWKGNLVKEREYILFVKTMKRNEDLVYKSISMVHDYEIPEIITISVYNAENNYLNWANEIVINK